MDKFIFGLINHYLLVSSYNCFALVYFQNTKNKIRDLVRIKFPLDNLFVLNGLIWFIVWTFYTIYVTHVAYK